MPENLPLIGDYRVVGHLGEGTFSQVLKCQSLTDGKLYACKKMKQRYDTLEQVNSLREIQALRRLNPHPNIIELKEVVFERTSGNLSLICELMEMNIYELIKDRRSYLSESRVKLYMYQLCKSLYHMHRSGIFHRDVKPENILVTEDTLKLADFGSCKSMYSKQPYTEYISTRWYRAPECLLTDGHYGHKMDMWSVGCVLFEVMSLRPLFPGSNELDQISRIHDVLGSPSSSTLLKFRKIQSRSMDFNFPYKAATGIGHLLRHASKSCVDLITKLCAYDPDERLSAKDALRHPFFRQLRDAERRVKQRVKAATLQTDTAASTLLVSPSRRKQPQRTYYKQRSRHEDELIPIKPKEFYLPPALGPGVPAASHIQKYSNAAVTLPQLSSKPSYHNHPAIVASHQQPSYYPSGYTSGLPSLTHSVKMPSRISAFPSLMASEHVSGKSSVAQHQVLKHHHHPQQHHTQAVHAHLPTLHNKIPVNARTRAA